MAGSREFELLFKLSANLGSNFKNAFGQAKKAAQELEKSITDSNKASRNIEGYIKTGLTLDKNIARQKQYKEELDELKRQQELAGGSSAQLEAKIARKNEQLYNATRAVEKNTQSLAQYEKELKAAGVDTSNLTQETKRLSDQVEEATKLQEKAAKIGSIQEDTRAAIRQTKFQLAGVIGVATALGTAMYKGPIKSAMDFESSMADVAKVVDGLKDSNGNLTEEYGKMKKEILDLTKVIPLTAEQLTEIAAAAGQAGIARNEITQFTSDAAKMGVAFNVTADEAGNYMAKWRTSFKFTQDEVVDLADKINYLGNTSAAEAGQIAEVVTSVGPLGDIAGFASGEIAALGGTLISVGIQEKVAATGIKKLMTTMTAGAAATKKQQQVLQSLGLDAVEMAERMQVDAKGAVIDLMEAIKKLPEAEQAAALKNYFGESAAGSIAPLLKNLDLLEENFMKVGDASLYAGSMQDEFASRSKTTENSIILAKNALKTVAITIGSVFLPAVAEIAQKIADLAGRFADFADKHPKLIKGLAGVTTAMLAAKAGSLALKLGFLNIKDAVLGIMGVITKLQAKNLITGASKFKVILGGIGGKLLPIIGIITAIGVAIKLISDNADIVREKIRAVFGEGGVEVFNNFLGIIERVTGAVKGIFGGETAEGASGFFQSFAEGNPIIESLLGLLQGLFTVASSVISALANAAQVILPVLWEIISTIGETLGRILEAVLPVLIDILGQILPILQLFAEEVIPILAEGILTVLNFLETIVSAILPHLAELIEFLLPILETMASVFTGVLHSAVQSVAEILGGLVGILSGLIDFIVGTFTGDWGRAWQGVQNIFKSAFDALVGIAKAPINAVISMVNAAIGGLNKIKIPEWVPGVGGKGINIPTIPMLWKGSPHAPDTFIAGEQGPELVMGRGGSKVFTAQSTKGIFTNLKESFLAAREVLGSFPTGGPGLAQGPSVALATAGGGKSIVIHSQPVFHLTNGDPAEIDEALRKNNEKLKREIKEELDNEEEDRRRRGY